MTTSPLSWVSMSQASRQSSLIFIRKGIDKDKTALILTKLLQEDCKDSELRNSLQDAWKTTYLEGRFSLFDGLLYHHQHKHASVEVIVDREIINMIVHECHDSVYTGNFSGDRRTLEKVADTAWWIAWRKDTMEFCSSCERFQKANEVTGKRFGLLMKIEEPSKP